MRELAQRVPDDGVHHTVDAHALPDGRVRIGDRTFSAREFADVLRRDPDWDGRPIRLLSCEAGGSGLARDLADELDVPVTAPRGLAWTDSSGRVFAGDMGPDGRPGWPPNGGWDTHNPGGTSTRASDDGFHPSRDGADPGARPDDTEARGEVERDSDGRPVRSIGTDSALSPPPDKKFGQDHELDANTRYRVVDQGGRTRGEFVTGSDGKITEIHTRSGSKGDWNIELLRPAHPNAVYHVQGVNREYQFEIDGEGRTVRASGNLEHTGSIKDRRMHQDPQGINEDQTSVGKEGRSEYEAYNDDVRKRFVAKHGREPSNSEVVFASEVGWDGGHLIANEFGGPGESINVVPMLRELNQNRRHLQLAENWRKMEMHIGDLVKRGKVVQVEIDVSYDPNSNAPHLIKVNYAVDGVAAQHSPFKFHNVPPRRR